MNRVQTVARGNRKQELVEAWHRSSIRPHAWHTRYGLGLSSNGGTRGTGKATRKISSAQNRSFSSSLDRQHRNKRRSVTSRAQWRSSLCRHEKQLQHLAKHTIVAFSFASSLNCKCDKMNLLGPSSCALFRETGRRISPLEICFI